VKDVEAGSVCSDDAAEIASESSLWEKLAPPVRFSPRLAMSASLIKQSSPDPAPAGMVVPLVV